MSSRLLLAVAAVLLVGASPSAAQEACARAEPGERGWSRPLDRAVTVRARDLSLRDALDRVSAAARVSLSYSPDLLPLDRRVCLDARRAPLGEALSALLRGTRLEPTVVAGQVVLTPAARAAPAATARAALPRMSVLEEIVVTGGFAGAPRRQLTVAMHALHGDALTRRNSTTLGEALNSSVPGMWVWPRDAASLLTHFGSIRGASSFGATQPKLYIDGVEVANPLLVSDLDMASVERVEVIRGPQGAALYGADAISGVINVVTRHTGAADGRRPEVSSRAGATSSRFAPSPLTRHQHRVALRGGSNLGSAGLAATVSGTGEVYPGAGSRSVGISGGGRWVTSSTIISASGRLSGRRAGVGLNPILQGADSGAVAGLDSLDQRVTHFTVGASALVAPDGAWTHTLLVGVDGYQTEHLDEGVGAYPAFVDSSLSLAGGAGMRASVRGSSTLRIEGERLTGAVTLAGEHSVLHQRTSQASGESWLGRTEETRRHDSGMMAQGNAALDERWYGSAGIRVQRSGGLGADDDLAVLPMLGAAWVRDAGPAEIKLRAAYGRGMRPAQTAVRSRMRGADIVRRASAQLEPEVQSGMELGAELHVAGRISLSVTRFDQLATGLIQDVVVGVDSVMGWNDRWLRRPHRQLQNVGEIDNRGWEAEAALVQGPLTVRGAFSLVESRVARVADRYTGELRPNDRMLGVPARTASLGVDWAAREWAASVTAARAWDWINYDRLAMARDAAGGQPLARLYGPELRAYWKGYEGSTELRATLWRRLRPGIWATLAGENLLGAQLNEPDNLSIRPGRTLSLGLRAGL